MERSWGKEVGDERERKGAEVKRDGLEADDCKVWLFHENDGGIVGRNKDDEESERFSSKWFVKRISYLLTL